MASQHPSATTTTMVTHDPTMMPTRLGHPRRERLAVAVERKSQGHPGKTEQRGDGLPAGAVLDQPFAGCQERGGHHAAAGDEETGRRARQEAETVGKRVL